MLFELLESALGAVLDRPVLVTLLVAVLVVAIYAHHIADVLIVASRWTRMATLVLVIVGVLVAAGVWTGAVSTDALAALLDAVGLAVTEVTH